jgi:pseudouridine-5'-monophosphatase
LSERPTRTGEDSGADSGRPLAVVFDLDGVLLDTEHFYTEVTSEIVAEYGKVFDWSIKRNMIGRPSLESARYLVDALKLPIAPEDYLARRSKRLVELFPKSEEVAGAEAFTRALAAAGVPLAVGTSSERELFELKIQRHADWFSLFSAVVVGDDPRVRKGKPAPDTFLVAAAELGVDPARCIVFEDSPVGLEAGLAAGMRVAAVPDPAMDRTAYEQAHWILDGYAAVSPKDFGF